jgi:hypothetical protein
MSDAATESFLAVLVNRVSDLAFFTPGKPLGRGGPRLRVKPQIESCVGMGEAESSFPIVDLIARQAKVHQHCIHSIDAHDGQCFLSQFVAAQKNSEAWVMVFQFRSSTDRWITIKADQATVAGQNRQQSA